MTGLPADRDPVPSPCVGICCIGVNGLCIGCYRTTDELARWCRASRAERAEILRRCRWRQEAAESDDRAARQ